MYTLAGFINIFKTIFNILQSCCTCIALIIGGLWTYKLFLQNRQKFPRAKLSYSFFIFPVTDKKFLFRVNLTVTNIGQVLLSLQSLKTKIQLIDPINKSLKKELNDMKDLIDDPKLEILWPMVASKKIIFDKNLHEVEPGESQEFQMDFILDNEYKIISIYSLLLNENKNNRNIGWDITTIYNLSKQEINMTNHNNDIPEPINPSKPSGDQNQNAEKSSPHIDFSHESTSAQTQRPEKENPPIYQKDDSVSKTKDTSSKD